FFADPACLRPENFPSRSGAALRRALCPRRCRPAEPHTSAPSHKICPVRSHFRRINIADDKSRTSREDVMRIASAGLRTSFALFLAALCSLLFLGSSLRLAQAQSSYASWEEKKRQANDIAVNVVVSGLSCTGARFAEDMRNVLNNLHPDGLRFLPVLGVGGLQNLNDVLFLKNIDMGVVDEDNMRFLKARDPR